MSDPNDLVERLRRQQDTFCSEGHEYLIEDAADYIDEAAATITRLTEALEAVVDAASYQDAVAFAAAALAGETP